MFLRNGLLLSFAAVFLQIAVFLQPLLPQQYQIAPVCETITRALLLDHSSKHASHGAAQQHSASHHSSSRHNSHFAEQQMHMSDATSHHHDADHHCQYCTVYGNLVLPPELDIKEVLDRIQVRLLAFQQAFAHVWFALQRLFLLPQGRAPPLFA